MIAALFVLQERQKRSHAFTYWKLNEICLTEESAFAFLVSCPNHYFKYASDEAFNNDK